MDAPDLDSFCFNLPKVELHAHLNTSFSLECLKQLTELNGNVSDISTEEMCIATTNDINGTFGLFKKIQKLVTTEETVYLLTRSVIREFAEDNVKYLELRSTPKQVEATGMTRELYLRTMIRAVKDSKKDGLDIIVRLLPSIDRRLGVEIAEVTVDLAHKLMKESDGIVIGIDFSGDPQVGNAEDYIPVFLNAAEKGLKLALHLEEIELHEETEKVFHSCEKYVNIMRIGHGTYLHQSKPGKCNKKVESFVINNKIPIEVCLTSNDKTLMVGSIQDSHFKYWLDKGHPLTLCTDGKGVFLSTLTEEYVKAAKAFNLSMSDLKQIAFNAVDCIFESDNVRTKLKERFNQL